MQFSEGYGLNIGRASIERMEGAASTDRFVQDKVKIVAEALGINLVDIIVVNHDSVEKIEGKLVTSGRELRELLDSTEKSFSLVFSNSFKIKSFECLS